MNRTRDQRRRRHRGREPMPRPGAIAASLIALCLVGGCQTGSVTTSDGRPMPPKPREAPAVPLSARANTVVMWLAAKPADTNGNGYPDLILAETYLFAQPHPTPMYEPGAFVIAMHAAGQVDQRDTAPIRQWRIEGEALERCKLRARFGPAYGLQLSLLEGGSTDRLPLAGADLTCEFHPADGSPAFRATGVSWIQIGRQVADQRSAGRAD